MGFAIITKNNKQFFIIKLYVLILFAFVLFLPPAHAADSPIWATMGSDAAVALQQALSVQGSPASFRMLQTRTSELNIVKFDPKFIPFVSHFMHRKFGRCGGFFAWQSYNQAVAEVDRFIAQQAAPSERGLAYTIDQGTVVNQALNEIDKSNIKATIIALESFGTRYYQKQHGQDAAVWLLNTWSAYAGDRSDVSVELYDHPGFLQDSVILTIDGAVFPDEVVVAGGHLDSINIIDYPNNLDNAPGSDDDASGVASITEAMRALFAIGFVPQRTIKFMAYAAEEVGLIGSAEIVQDYKLNGVDVIGVLQLDMTNYHGSIKDVYLTTDYTSPAQNDFIRDLLDTYNQSGPHALTYGDDYCGYACSDHASWHNQGYPVSYPFEAYGNEYNPYYHTELDILANSDQEAAHAEKFAKVAAEFLVELAKSAELCTGTDDYDNDGTIDCEDNCPHRHNPYQIDCDGDGIGNACDNCPNNCNFEQLDADSDGIGDVCDPFPGCGGCNPAPCEQECTA